jgi:triphosphoribosyl-dephospho-CoA synthetase
MVTMRYILLFLLLSITSMTMRAINSTNDHVVNLENAMAIFHAVAIMPTADNACNRVVNESSKRDDLDSTEARRLFREKISSQTLESIRLEAAAEHTLLTKVALRVKEVMCDTYFTLFMAERPLQNKKKKFGWKYLKYIK